MTVTAEPLLTARRRMPQRRQGYTASVTIGGADFYLTANPNADGTLGEVFIKFGKQGSTLGGLLDAVSISVSIGLQSGVPLQTFVSKYINMRFEPFGDDRRPRPAHCHLSPRLRVPAPSLGFPRRHHPQPTTNLQSRR